MSKPLTVFFMPSAEDCTYLLFTSENREDAEEYVLVDEYDLGVRSLHSRKILDRAPIQQTLI
jgi:hypothetical protein